jgi:hypothetical protein
MAEISKEECGSKWAVFPMMTKKNSKSPIMPLQSSSE